MPKLQDKAPDNTTKGSLHWETKLSVALVVLLLLWAVFVYQSKLQALKNAHQTADTLLPMCKTIAEILHHSPDPTRVYSALENSQFRATWVTVYSNDGEVWADSFSPCQGKLPVPASEHQKDVFRLVKERKALEEPGGVLLHHFGRCRTTQDNDASAIAAKAVEGKGMLVVLQTCGMESK